MNKILELREKRTKAWEAAKAFLDTKRGADGLVSDEDTATYEKMEADVLALGREIDRLEKQAALDLELSKPTSVPLTGKPGTGEQPKALKTGRASDEYKRSMLDALRSNFRRVSDILQEGVDADGGYLVPVEYDDRLIESLKEENIFRQFATIIKTGGERKINIAASTPAAAWIEEGGALTFGDATFEQITHGVITDDDLPMTAPVIPTDHNGLPCRQSLLYVFKGEHLIDIFGAVEGGV